MNMRNTRSDARGIAALPAVIIFGGIIIEVALASAFLAFTLNNTSLGVRLSAEAFAAAKSGVEDAMLRILRDKNYSDPTGYSISLGRATVDVVVNADTPDADKTTITSTGTAFRRKRQIQAIVSIDAVSGIVKVISLKEISL